MSVRYWQWGMTQVLCAPRAGFTSMNRNTLRFVPRTAPNDFDHSAPTVCVVRDPFERWVSGVYHYSKHAHRTAVKNIVDDFKQYMYIDPTTDDFRRFFDAVTVRVAASVKPDYHYTSQSRYFGDVLGKVGNINRAIPCESQHHMWGEDFEVHNTNTYYYNTPKVQWLERAEPVRARVLALWREDTTWRQRSLNEWSSISQTN